MLGEAARLVSRPAAQALLAPAHVWAPAAVAGAAAPGPPPSFDPYVIVNACPAERVSPETVILRSEIETLPTLAFVNPAARPAVEGALHPGGTVRVTVPPKMPPVAGAYLKTIVLPRVPARTE